MTINIQGVVETPKEPIDWLNEFAAWLKSRGESFGGGIS